MAILNFAAFNQYAKTTSALAVSNAATIRPESNGVWYRWQQHTTVFNSMMKVPPENIEKFNRPWLYIQPFSNITTSVRNITLTITNADIAPELMVPGNVICYGYKFATAQTLNGTGRYFIGYRAPSTSSVTALTPITTHSIGPNEYRWIDFRFTIRENLSVLIEMFVNKELVHSFTAANGQIWGVGTGSISSSLFVGPTNWATQGFYVNDFLTILDKVDGEDNTGLIGPITVKELPVSSVKVSGDWKTPAGMTVTEALNNKRTKYPLTLETDQQLQSDPYGKPLTALFEYPKDEAQSILAMQESFIIQKPPSESSAMEYQRIFGEAPIGDKQVFSPDNTDDAVLISTAVTLPVNGVAFTPEEITGRGVTFNSVKKLVKD